MALHLAKKLSRSLLFPTPHLRVTLLPLLRLSTAASKPKDPPFLTQYLISSFGFSSDRALKCASTSQLFPIKTSDRPEAVVRFFRETGLTDSEIKRLISWNPQLLCYSVSKTLEPNLRSLVSGGFSRETLTQLIQISPNVLLLKSALPRLKFWRDFTGNDEALLTTIRGHYRLLHVDIDEVVLPVINLLKDSGYSDVDIRRLYTALGAKLKNPENVKKLIKETEALGFSAESGMFIYGLIVVAKYKMDTIKRKMEFFRNSYGWSDEELHAAFKTFPTIDCQSEKTLKCKMDFLLGSVGFTKQNIISIPVILGYSLEKRLVPRYHVLNILKIQGLHKGTIKSTVFMVSEQGFLDKFVRPYIKEVPELEDIYASSRQGKMSI